MHHPCSLCAGSYTRRVGSFARASACALAVPECRSCQTTVPNALDACASCGAAPPRAASDAWKAVQQRRTSNMHSQRALALRYFQGCEQEQESLSAGMGARTEANAPSRTQSRLVGRRFAYTCEYAVRHQVIWTMSACWRCSSRIGVHDATVRTAQKARRTIS